MLIYFIEGKRCSKFSAPHYFLNTLKKNCNTVSTLVMFTNHSTFKVTTALKKLTYD